MSETPKSPPEEIPPPGSSRHTTSHPPAAETTPTTLKAIAGSPGVAVGPALVLGDLRTVFVRRHLSSSHVDAEIARVRQAVQGAQNSLKDVHTASMQSGPARDYAPILEAYLAMMNDPFLLERVETRIRSEKKCAEWAVAESAEEISRSFGANSDAYIAERRHDIEFVCDRLLRALVGESANAIPRLEEPMVLVARDLSPADTAGLVREPALAFVTEIGSRTSHTSITARALEIPAVVGASSALATIRTGDMVVVDGLRGEVVVHPTPEMIEDAKARQARHLAFARGLLSAKDRPCLTACGERVALKANVELPAEAVLALDHGADGIGLYRTEFVFIDRTTLPDEDDQYALYRAVVEAMAPKPVTLRTFDIGGDKFVSSFKLPAEMNPALGLRAVRLALREPEIFLVQLRAMVRASAHGDVRIMIPMVASLFEMREVRRLLARATAQVDAAGQPRAARIPLGMMVEVPAAAVMADVFARDAEFFSLGTNDLIQYALAIDRTSQTLASLASPFDPSILRLIANVSRVGREARLPVSVCGAMASDPLAACLLLGMGLRELSMEAAAIPEIKEAFRRVTVAECEAAARTALEAESADAVEELVAHEFAPRLIDLMAGSADTSVTITRSSHPP